MPHLKCQLSFCPLMPTRFSSKDRKFRTLYLVKKRQKWFNYKLLWTTAEWVKHLAWWCHQERGFNSGKEGFAVVCALKFPPKKGGRGTSRPFLMTLCFSTSRNVKTSSKLKLCNSNSLWSWYKRGLMKSIIGLSTETWLTSLTLLILVFGRDRPVK